MATPEIAEWWDDADDLGLGFNYVSEKATA